MAGANKHVDVGFEGATPKEVFHYRPGEPLAAL
jgi:hypothetical protein